MAKKPNTDDILSKIRKQGTGASGGDADASSSAAEAPAEKPKAAPAGGPADIMAKIRAQGAPSSSSGAAGFGETRRGPEEDVNKIFEKAIEGVEPAIDGEAAPTKAPLLEGVEAIPGAAETPAAEAPQALELEEQSSLKFHAPVKRIAFRAGFGRATVSRTSVVVNDEYVVPAAVALRLVSR